MVEPTFREYFTTAQDYAGPSSPAFLRSDVPSEFHQNKER